MTFIDYLLKIDTDLFHQINRLTYGEVVLTPLMLMLSSILFWTLFGVVFIAWQARKGGGKAIKAFCLIAISLGLSDVFTFRVLKPFFGRIRPCYAFQDVILRVEGCGSQVGFPSNHAANAMTITLVLILFFSLARKRYELLIFPLLIGFSRIYLGVHYPLDVLGGFIVGGGLASIISFLGKRYDFLKPML